ncbi:DUF1097 domain-containing protein [Clostridium estertheticum]|uniref:DUF1097 domain-containing protein n=1 Tax=Clostridium estertheticum TaxID=238834 RepID=UPI0027154E6C|nr:DUF1097 domain-containing protein [Clostridium estertheticum]
MGGKGKCIDALNSSAISIGLLSGVWIILSTKLGLMAWVGFMGCTSYYAAGNRFVKGWKKSVICNMSGILWAMIAIKFSNMIPIPEPVAVMTTIISFFIIAQAKIPFLAFIPGTFVGCASTFGMNGNWKATIVALLMGSVLGIVSDVGGVLIKKLTERKSDKTISQVL